MKHEKLRRLIKQINYGNEIQVRFVFAEPEYFCYETKNNTLEVSTFFHKLSDDLITVYLLHEIGHFITIPRQLAMFVSDYKAEYEANRWAMYRLDELNWPEILGEYKRYLQDLASMKTEDDLDEEYQEAASDLLEELELV